MFLDASAIVAILAGEDGAAALAARIDQAAKIYTSPIALCETALGLAQIGNIPLADAEAALDLFLAEVRAEIVPIGAETARLAIEAFARFGKGRHRANLNLGDCFAYACARTLDAPLLYKGDDFPHTDVAAG